MILATRIRKARRNSTCGLCRAPITIAQRIGQAGSTWAHVTCIISRNTSTPGSMP